MTESKVSAYTHLVDVLLERGYTVSVHDGEEWATKRSTDRVEIIGTIESVDECAVKIRKDGNHIGTFNIVLGNDPWEDISDYGCSYATEKEMGSIFDEVEKRCAPLYPDYGDGGHSLVPL